MKKIKHSLHSVSQCDNRSVCNIYTYIYILKKITSKAHLGHSPSTHQEHEDDSQNDAEADHHEGNVDDDVLLGDDGLQLHGRRVVDQDALRR